MAPIDILGISCFYHDSAAVLVRDGRIRRRKPTGGTGASRPSRKTGFPSDFEGDTMANQSLIKDFWEFMRVRNRYRLLPIVIVLGLLSALIVFTEGSAVAPFIYALF